LTRLRLTGTQKRFGVVGVPKTQDQAVGCRRAEMNLISRTIAAPNKIASELTN